MSAEITKEEAEAALWDFAAVVNETESERYTTLLTLARAGAAVLFPGEEDVERVAAHVANALWPAVPDAHNIRVLGEDAREAARRAARSAIAAMKP